MFNTLTKALCGIVSIIQVIPSFYVFNKPLEIPSYIPLFSQLDAGSCTYNLKKKSHYRYVVAEVQYVLGHGSNEGTKDNMKSYAWDSS